MSKSLSTSLAFDVPSLALGQRQKFHAVLDLKGLARGVDATRPPLSIAFAVDVSGSMQGQPLEHVVDSLTKLVAFLDDTDRVGLVAFSDQAAEIAPVQPLTASHRALLTQRVRRLRTQARTNIQDGLEVARRLLPARAPHERQLVLLLTDGQPNVGAASAEALMAIAASFRPEVSVTTLGYGAHHQEDLLVAIAKGGGGEYIFIHDPQECELELAKAIGSQGEVVADNVELVLQLEDGVELTDHFAPSPPRLAGSKVRFVLPDLFEGQSRSIVLQLSVEDLAFAGPFRLGQLEVRCRTVGSAVVESEAIPMQIGAMLQPGPPVRDVVAKVLVGRTDRVRSEARQNADRGNYDVAAALIRRFMQEIQAADVYATGDGSPLDEAYEQLVDEAVAYETRPSAEQYRNYKRAFLGVEAATGGVHQGDRAAASQKSAVLVANVIGEIPDGEVCVDDGNGKVQRFPIAQELTIGRVAGNDIALSTGQLSKRHTRLVVREGHVIVVDLRSTNGTYVNGKRITSPHIMQKGDVVQLGPAKLWVEVKPK